MKNLSLFNVFCSKTNNLINPELCCFVNDKLYIITQRELFLLESNNMRHVCDFNNIPQIQENSTTLPVHLEECCATGELVVSFSGGELIYAREGGESEFVGCIDPGIASALWSPSGDVYAVVTTSLNLVVLSQDLDPIRETELRRTGEEEQISVGWGKEETQFRGSEGKLKNDTAQSAIDKVDDGRVRLSWRGDGEFLVVSYQENGQRFLKVINNNGILIHSSQPMSGLESSLCWRPNGSIIASTQKLPNKRMVCFFEKNLLPHGGFRLSSEVIVQELLWNCDSSVLALVLKEKGEVFVKLFTVGNYHWYDKYTVPVAKSERLVTVDWDKVETNLLNLVTSSKDCLKYFRYHWQWTTSTSNGSSNDDEAWVAVIDGRRLLLTAFRKAIVPPPMSSAVLELSAPVSDVSFIQYGAECSKTSSNDLVVYSIDGSLSVFKYDGYANRHNFLASGMAHDRNLWLTTWVNENQVLACALKPDGSDELIMLEIPSSEKEKTLKFVSIPLTEPVLAMRRVPNENSVLLLQKENMQIFDLISMQFSKWLHSLPQWTGKLSTFEIRNKVFTLDSAHRLFADNTLVASNVTSFRICDDYLIATTLQHKLLCWSLNNLRGNASERSIERGARIVTAVPTTSNVILQMPRGNLETILPRALTITALKKLLNELNFRKAIMLMRRERINLNLIYDHNPNHFEENLALFLNEVNDPNLLCTFIAELSNENVTQTLYSSFYPTAERVKDSKQVCSLILTTMECRHDRSNLLLPILSCLVKNNETENALLLVKSTLDAEKQGQYGPVSSSDGLTHILYLVDLETLFKIALGTYDLNLVMFIASKSQKDPKEYLPFLSNLQQKEENYQKFTIDNFLKRYKSALQHLALCADRVNECLEYVSSHKLYRTALRIFATDTDTWKAVCVLYASELTQKSRHEEAGLILQRAGEFLLAQHAFSRAGAWKSEIACAESLRMPQEQKMELVKSIAEGLMTSKRFEEAGRLLADHSSDVVGAVTAFCAGNLHDEAIRVACLAGRKDLVGSVVKESAVAACSHYLVTIAEAGKTMDSLLQRLREVQDERKQGGIEWDDSLSESSKSSSRGSSRATSRSAKNARKLERNLMKKGSPYEDIAIIATLHTTISHTVALKSMVQALNLVLVYFDEQSHASKLQKAMEQFLGRVKVDVAEVWPAARVGSGETSTSNAISAAFIASRQQLPGPVQALQPKVLFPPDLMNNVAWQLEILMDF